MQFTPRAPETQLTSRSAAAYDEFDLGFASSGEASSAFAAIHSQMPANTTKLIFWGVRGSTPTLERDTWRYGGNTACVEVMAAGGTRFILDCGTGLRMLGNRLHAQSQQWAESHGPGGLEAHVLVTHYHWDHIQGIPFFLPFFEPHNSFHFASFQSKYLGRNSLRQVLEAQLAKPYFPVDVSIMEATRSFREVAGGEQWDVHGTHISTAWLNHPQGCLGYRLDTPTGSIVYATDNEPGVSEFDNNIRELARGADVLIYDAQYSRSALAQDKKGWGHSSWEEGVAVAKASGAKQLILFHHDPDSDDRAIDELQARARTSFPNCHAAYEVMDITV